MSHLMHAQKAAKYAALREEAEQCLREIARGYFPHSNRARLREIFALSPEVRALNAGPAGKYFPASG